MFEHLRADLSRYAELGFKWHSEPGFWISANYRFGHWACKLGTGILRRPLVVIHKITSFPIRFVLASGIDRDAEIGPGLALIHGHGILVPSGSRIGKNCTIYHDVTLGLLESRPGTPQLDDHVVVFAGARVLGGISIGAHAEIGPNTVVTRDIPAEASVAPPVPRVLTREMVRAMRGDAPKTVSAMPSRNQSADERAPTAPAVPLAPESTLIGGPSNDRPLHPNENGVH